MIALTAWHGSHICANCGSLLLFGAPDVRRAAGSRNPVVRCPTCAAWEEIAAPPPHIVKNAPAVPAGDA